MIYFVEEHWRLPLKIRYFNFYKSTHEKIILDDFVRLCQQVNLS